MSASTPIWLGNLPRDPENLQQAQKDLALAMVKISEELGSPIDVSEISFRFHTKGSSSNGKGLGFGFAWLPTEVAQRLIYLGQLPYGSACASVRESRGAKPAKASGEQMHLAVGATCKDFCNDFLAAFDQWQDIFGAAELAINLHISDKNGLIELSQLLKQKKSLLRRFPAAILWRPSDVLGHVESLVKAAISAEHLLILVQMEQSQTVEEHRAIHSLQAGLRNMV